MREENFRNVKQVKTVDSFCGKTMSHDSQESGLTNSQRGIALVTVLAILTLLVIFATAFIQTVRIEVQTTKSFKEQLSVTGTSKNGTALVGEELATSLYGPDQIAFSGDEFRPYVSLLDAWAIGKAGVIENSPLRTVYDYRRWLFNTPLLIQNNAVILIHNGAVWEARPREGTTGFTPLPYLAQRGVDEDPDGKFFSGGDPKEPGLPGIDDDLNGSLDVNEVLQQDFDDDEDGLTDEDGVDLRAVFLGESVDGGGRVDNLIMGWDEDGDATGIMPSSGKVNIGIAGNRNGPNESHIYHQGIHPSELDLETFMAVMVGWNTKNPVALAQLILTLREGPGGGPGLPFADDNQNNTAAIMNVNPNDIDDVPGNLEDDDGDGLTDEEDEIFAGGTVFLGGQPSDLVDNRGNRGLVLSNGIDDGGLQNVIDDVYEIDDADIETPGIDDLRETRPSDPYGDDTPPRQRIDLTQITAFNQPASTDPEGPTVFELIEPYITTESNLNRQSQESNKDRPGNRRKLNPNLVLSQTPALSRQPVSYLYPLAGLDNDGDWGSNSVMLAGARVRDDSNSNFIPDGDWDGEAEETSGVLGNNLDEDYDGKPDDDGDSNGDKTPTYDPEGGVDEDRPTYAGVSQADIGFATSNLDLFANDGIDNNSNSVLWLSDGIDNDGDGLTDETFVDDAAGKDEGVDEPGEYYIQSWDDEANSAGNDGRDNDGDGLTDEGDEVGANTEVIGGNLGKSGGKTIYRFDEDPIDVQLVANLADSLDYTNDPGKNDGVTKVEIRNASEGYVVQAQGTEAVRITEVLARPLIRLQAEDAQSFTPSGATNHWGVDNSAGSEARRLHYFNSDGEGTGRWTFGEIPEGKFYVLVYSWGRDASSTAYTVGANSTVKVQPGTPQETTLSMVKDATPVPAAVLLPDETLRNVYLASGQPRLFYSQDPVEFDGNTPLEIEIQANNDNNVSFDYVELYAPDAQYVEICNFGERTVDLNGWEIRTATSISRIDSSTATLKPGQFGILYAADNSSFGGGTPTGPSGIAVLKETNYGDPSDVGSDPLRLTADSLVDSGTGSQPLALTTSLQDILFSSDDPRVVELWAPAVSPATDVSTVQDFVLVDSFYYHPSSDFCAPIEVYKRQDKMAFAPQHRGDPTVSLLHHELSKLNGEEMESYVHGPMRFRAEDAVVTIGPMASDAVPSANEITKARDYKATAMRGRTLADAPVSATASLFKRTDFGEMIFSVSGEVINSLANFVYDASTDDASDVAVTFYWPGILNYFRDPSKDSGTGAGLPDLYIRAGGVSGATIGIVDVREKKSDPTKLKLVFSGDLLYHIDSSVYAADENAEDYDHFVDLNSGSIRITIRIPDNDTEFPGTGNGSFYFSYIEISPGFPEGKGMIAGDPGMEHFYYPDQNLVGSDGSRFLFMERRRNGLRFQRSLRFREGRMANCSPYLAGAGGRNIEKYSMGRGVFSGPTIQEMKQIATRMEFIPSLTLDGQINVNVADEKVLCALPFMPPESPGFSDISRRANLAVFMAQALVMGRSQRGLDGELGVIGTDDDADGRADFADVGALPPNALNQYRPSWDANPGINGFGRFRYDDDGDGITDGPSEYKVPGSDDGPYGSVGEVASVFLHPLLIQYLRSGSAAVGINEGQLKPSEWGDTSWAQRPRFDETDMFIMMGRIMNLVTVQANEFTVLSRGRVFEPTVDETNQTRFDLVAQQGLEEDVGSPQ